jgi:deoxyribose-phosphate aldolase
MIDRKTLTSCIDHSLLRPNLTEAQVIADVNAVLPLNVASFCVMPCYLDKVNTILNINHIDNPSTTTKLSTVIGFPHGNVNLRNKLIEIETGALYPVTEYDVVINYSNVLSGNWKKVVKELTEVYKICKEQSALLKVIFETCYLQDRHIITLCELCADVMETGFVKTSTGFGSGGATPEHIKLMKEHSKHLGVKASGGVRTLSQVETMIECGATRVGATATLSIIKEYDELQQLIKAGKPLPDTYEPPF